MEKMKNAINWFEIPVTDFDRAVRFYSAIYDNEMPTRDMGHVRMGFFSHEQGQIGGAVVSGLNGGTDLTAVLGRVESAGGSIITAKAEISPEIGHVAIIQDTEGNHIYLHSMN